MEILVGFVLSLGFLAAIGGLVFGVLAWREARRARPALAQGLRVMADLVEEMGRQVRVAPEMTGAPRLRALAEETLANADPAPRRKKPEGPRASRMRPLTDEEEWALEQERGGFDGLPDSEVAKARQWANRVREDRLAVAEE